MSLYNSKPITQLIPGSPVKSTDVYPAVDVTDLTQSPSGSTKKYTIADLQSYIITVVNASNIRTAYTSATGNLNAVYVNNPSGMAPGVGATLTNAGALGVLVLDGITVTLNMRVLIQFQSSSFQNGIYEVLNPGSLSEPWVLARVPDFDGSALGKIEQGDFVGVLFGATYALSFWFMDSPTVVTIGTDPITFVKQTNPIQFPWINQTTTTASLSPNTGYTTNVGASLVTYTLPVSAPAGSQIQITGFSSGGYTINQNVGQSIVMGTSTTTIGVGGSLTPINYRYGLVLTCIIANTLFQVTSSTGPFDLL
jgi:hypothetical protein